MSKHDDCRDNRFRSYLVWGDSRAKKTIAHPNAPGKLDWITGRACERVDSEVILDTPIPLSKILNPLSTLAYRAPATTKPSKR